MKFRGIVGFAIISETAPGVYEEELVEREYAGDVGQDRVNYKHDAILPNAQQDVVVKIVPDNYCRENMFSIRTIDYNGKRWNVRTVIHAQPRVEIRFDTSHASG